VSALIILFAFFMVPVVLYVFIPALLSVWIICSLCQCLQRSMANVPSRYTIRDHMSMLFIFRSAAGRRGVSSITMYLLLPIFDLTTTPVNRDGLLIGWVFSFGGGAGRFYCRLVREFCECFPAHTWGAAFCTVRDAVAIRIRPYYFISLLVPVGHERIWFWMHQCHTLLLQINDDIFTPLIYYLL